MLLELRANVVGDPQGLAVLEVVVDHHGIALGADTPFNLLTRSEARLLYGHDWQGAWDDIEAAAAKEGETPTLLVWQARLTGVATPAAERDERLKSMNNDQKRSLTRVAVLAALRRQEREARG